MKKIIGITLALAYQSFGSRTQFRKFVDQMTNKKDKKVK